jgi:hypothetical protein
MNKCLPAPRVVISLLVCASVSLVSAVYAQSPNLLGDADGPPGGSRSLEPGQPHAQIHPTVDKMEKYRASHNSRPGSGGASKLLAYRGGNGGIGVETAPKVYLVLWGSQWINNDPSGEAAILESFFDGVGGSPWLNSVTQYCQGVAKGTTNCNGAGIPAGNQAGIYAGYWNDNATAAPSHPTQSQLAAEAVKAAQYFANTNATLNSSVQYVIATAHNNNASGFGTQYCAWHSYALSTVGNVAYTNLPYMTDAGASCGANFNNLGANAGITIVEGHELAETITDQFPSSGWLDGGGEENGDKCAWVSSGAGASANITLSSGVFPVQTLWSNAANTNAGGCVIYY